MLAMAKSKGKYPPNETSGVIEGLLSSWTEGNKLAKTETNTSQVQ